MKDREKEEILKNVSSINRKDVAFGVYHNKDGSSRVQMLLHVEFPSIETVKAIISFCENFVKTNTNESIAEQNKQNRIEYCKKYGGSFGG